MTSTRGKVENGDDCYDYGECADGICVGYDSSGGDSEPGTCRPIGEEDGDTCYDYGGCEEGLNCDMDSDGEEGTCRELAREGDSCTDAQCEEGTYCATEDSDEGGTKMVCREQAADGEECESSMECESYNCTDVNDEGVGTCEPYDSRGSEPMCTGEE